MKLYISADIEGTCGICHWDETEKNKPDWSYFSRQMTREVAAACEGAHDAGWDDILIKDAHDSARNLDPAGLPIYTRLFRGWGCSPLSMVAGLDETFDGLVCTGYHNAAGTASNPLSHTMNTQNVGVFINGVRASELMINALTAAQFGVPLLCVAGDKGLCDSARAVLPGLETVPVNEGVGNGVIAIHPDLAVDRIREAVRRACAKEDRAAGLWPTAPSYHVEIHFRRHQDATSGAAYPDAVRVSDTCVAYDSVDWFDVLKMIQFVL